MHALEKAYALLQVIVGSIEDAAIGLSPSNNRNNVE